VPNKIQQFYARRNSAARLNDGNAKFKNNDFAGAISDYSAAINFDSNYEKPYFNRGLLNGITQDYAEAILDYSEAIKIKAEVKVKDTWAFFLRGVAKEQLRDFEGAFLDYMEATLSIPQFVEAYKRRTLTKYARQHPDSPLPESVRANYDRLTKILGRAIDETNDAVK
jgi:tetratricopeptide (TPR) repeat protein